MKIRRVKTLVTLNNLEGLINMELSIKPADSIQVGCEDGVWFAVLCYESESQ